MPLNTIVKTAATVYAEPSPAWPELNGAIALAVVSTSTMKVSVRPASKASRFKGYDRRLLKTLRKALLAIRNLDSLNAMQGLPALFPAAIGTAADALALNLENRLT